MEAPTKLRCNLGPSDGHSRRVRSRESCRNRRSARCGVCRVSLPRLLHGWSVPGCCPNGISCQRSASSPPAQHAMAMSHLRCSDQIRARHEHVMRWAMLSIPGRFNAIGGHLDGLKGHLGRAQPSQFWVGTAHIRQDERASRAACATRWSKS